MTSELIDHVEDAIRAADAIADRGRGPSADAARRISAGLEDLAVFARLLPSSSAPLKDGGATTMREG